MNKSITTYSLFLFTLSAVLTACSDTISSFFGDGEIEQGEAVVFNTMVPDVSPATRSAKSKWQEKVGAYKAVEREYTFTVEMWKQGDDAVTATSTYKPISTDENGEIKYNTDGTLQVATDATPLYWQDNVSKWGFKAYTTNTDVIAADQSDQTKWLAQDKLIGYSYLPIWTGTDEEGHETDNINGINYRTSKQWYRDNQAAKELSGLMHESNEDYKKIPLYLQHQRSWVTVILKAGEGVTREALAYATSEANIKTTIYSYRSGQPQADEITAAWSKEELVNYDSDKNGEAATGVSTTRYDAIVEPHNYLDPASIEKDIIARINVSNQNFTFAAANDSHYSAYINEADDNHDAAVTAMQAYNLEAGKHLTITAELSRASRMIMITAWIEDWTETVTQTVCDDYGNNGDPILINNRAELEDFLNKSEKNKAGNVGLIVPTEIDLTDGDAWDSSRTLNATLNLAGAKLIVNKQLLDHISISGNVVNGEIAVADGFNDKTAVANVNAGTVERIRVTTSGEATTARASVAGIIDTNNGNIYQCTSALPVYGTTDYVGGIAAKNLNPEQGGIIAVIDACTVTSRVDGNSGVKAGGGIVGQAEGHVSNNTFEYGITISQSAKFQNIIAELGTNALTQHSNNSWPTSARYTIPNTSTEVVNSYPGQKYAAVIDNREELKLLLTSTYNTNSIYRVAGSFEVDKENWIWGSDKLNDDYFSSPTTDGYAHGNVKFKLNGNGKTITLTGTSSATMLFGSIIGEIYDLKLRLAQPIVADRIMDNKGEGYFDSNTDAIAALAYNVTCSGEANGVIRNISLTAAPGAYIQASTPAGIAVWVTNNARVEACSSNVPVQMHLTTTGTDVRRYAGGIVATAERATITRCKYYAEDANSISGLDEYARTSNCHYGGIVGGTSELRVASGDLNPHLVLTDCSSWWNIPPVDPEQSKRPTMGGVIGTACYNKDHEVFNAMAEGNAGNWWVGTVGAGRLKDGITEDVAIGRKNSVQPTKPTGL